MTKALPLFLTATGLAVGLFYFRATNRPTPPPSYQKAVDHQATQKEQPANRPVQKITKPSLSSQVMIDVPFTPQAPYAVWDEVHQEACEEAAVLMAVYALDKRALNPDLAEEKIQKIVAWEKDTFGFFEDTNAELTAKIVTDYFSQKAEIKYDFAIADLKKAVSEGHPVVVLAAGRLLGNPYYRSPGPIYHALVIRWFDGDRIITNDPGTKRGDRYTYKSSVIMKAAHEWVGDPDKIAEGRPAMIIVQN